MGYGACSHGTGYVDLGTNMLDTTAATIEIWARHDGVENWSRVFDYGADNAHYFQMPWTNGTNLNKDSIGAKNGGGETQAVDTMAPYEIGTDYYMSANDVASAFFAIKKYEQYKVEQAAKAAGKYLPKIGDYIHIVGKIVNERTCSGYYGEYVEYEIFNALDGLTYKRCGVVKSDGEKNVNCYAFIRDIWQGNNMLDRTTINAKKGVAIANVLQ